jgi:hypothetical protein
METKKEKDELLPLRIIGVIILLGAIGYFVFNNSSQNSGSSDLIQPVVSTTQDSNNNTIPTISSTTLSNTEMCKKHAQLVADSAGSAAHVFYSVQSYHYSNVDNVCYFELHYQMNTTYQGNKYISQVYHLEAVSLSQMEAYPDLGLSYQEASCIVSEKNYYGATTDCEYYGLIFSTQNGYTLISNKYDMSGGAPPMSYSDYEALVQKRMNN